MTLTPQQICEIFVDLVDYDTLHDSIAEDIEDTRLNKGDGPRVCDMPGMGFHYVLDTENFSMHELSNIANQYAVRLAALNNEMIESTERHWHSWDILKYVTGSDSVCSPPRGVAVVVSDSIDTYAYHTVSKFAYKWPTYFVL